MDQPELPGAVAIVTPVAGWCPWCPHRQHASRCATREGASGWRCPCTGQVPQVVDR